MGRDSSPKRTSKRKEPKAPNLRNLIYSRKWDECIKVAESYPCQTEKADRMGDLPLHEACSAGAPFQLVKTLHAGYPDGIQHKGFCGRLPLHYASYNKPSLHIIKFLLRQYPDGASKFDDDGRLPLHLAVVRNAPKQAIQELIAAYPRSLTIPNQFGNTPEMLARNEHVYELLMEEKAKPRKIDQHLDIEKRLMRDWFGGSKSPILQKSSSEEKEEGNMQTKKASTSQTATTPKVNVSSTKARTTSMKQQEKQQQQQQHNQRNSRYSPHATTSSIYQTPSSSKKSHLYHTPRISNKKMHKLTQSTRTANKILSNRRNGHGTGNQCGVSTASTRSSSSGRSRKTIEATHHDMSFLEKSSKSLQYNASRTSSPRSPIDINNFPSRMSRPRSSYNKKEVMSTKNRRKVLPSPTRINMVVHPVWK